MTRAQLGQFVGRVVKDVERAEEVVEKINAGAENQLPILANSTIARMSELVNGKEVVPGLLGKPRIRGLIYQHGARQENEWTETDQSCMSMVFTERSLTSGGACRAMIRSCCNVLSAAVCFRKFCSGFEGPQRASPMFSTVKKRTKRREYRNDSKCSWRKRVQWRGLIRYWG